MGVQTHCPLWSPHTICLDLLPLVGEVCVWVVLLEILILISVGAWGELEVLKGTGLRSGSEAPPHTAPGPAAAAALGRLLECRLSGPTQACRVEVCIVASPTGDGGACESAS